MRTAIAGMLVAVFALAAPDAAAAASPRLKEVRKVYMGHFSPVGKKRGRTVVVAYGSQDEVQKRLTAALVGSGRFVVVEKLSEADAVVEGEAGYVNSEKDGRKFTTGFADLKLIQAKSQEVVWTFEYKPQPGAGGSAAQRVADQFIESLLADAKMVDAR